MERKHAGPPLAGMVNENDVCCSSSPCKGGEEIIHRLDVNFVLKLNKNSVLFSPETIQFKKIKANYGVILCIFPQYLLMLSARLQMTQLHEPADNKTLCGYAHYSKIYYLTNI